MDLSKLPKLSETDKHAPPPPPPEPQFRAEPLPYSPPSTGLDLGAQIWLSGILGIVFMLMGRSFASYLIATLTGQTYHTGVDWVAGPNVGQEVGYYELQGYTGQTDTAVFLFGFCMVLEAIALIFVRRNTPTARTILTVALVVTVGMTLYNLGLALFLVGKNALPLLSILAVAFGGYTAMTEWQTLQHMKANARARV
jgi:hypothetical protein